MAMLNRPNHGLGEEKGLKLRVVAADRSGEKERIAVELVRSGIMSLVYLVVFNSTLSSIYAAALPPSRALLSI